MFALLLTLMVAAPAHSLSVFKVPDVIVTATRTEISPQNSPSKVTDLDAQELSNIGISDLSSILSIADGVFVNEYGPTQLSTASVRGTAAEETLFMVDGVKLNSVQNGVVDLSLIPVTQIGRIEIAEGGSSALFGSDAIGGIVDIQTTMDTSQSAGVTTGGGSYDFHQMRVDANEKIGDAFVGISLERKRARNDYDFNYSDGLNDFQMKRTGADYVSNDQLVKLTIPDDESTTSIMVSNLSAEHGTPGAVTGPFFVGTQREYDNDLLAVVNHERQLSLISLSTSLGFTYDYLRYVEPPVTESGFAIDDFYKMISLQPSVQANYNSEAIDVASGVDAESDRGTSSEMIGTKHRSRVGVFVSTVVNLSGPFSSEVHLSTSGRMDWYSDFGDSFNPKFGINIKPIRLVPVNLRASVGTSFRAPTFNELYYEGSGNPGIKPEKSLNFDAGAAADIGSPLNIHADMDFYSIGITDGIQWLPGTDGIWHPQDYKKILSQGIEFGIQSHFAGIIGLHANYSFGRCTDLSVPNSPSYNKQLIYRPQEQTTMVAVVSPWIMIFSTTLRYASFRYTTAQNDEFLPGFIIVDGSAGAKITAGHIVFSPSFSIKNIFNHNYQIVPQYPMPLRTFYLSLNIQFDQ